MNNRPLERVATVMVRGFYDAYFTGLLEATLPEGAPRQPRHLKQLAADRYGRLATDFTATLMPVLLGLTFPSWQEAVADMRRRHFSDSTPPRLLLRHACGSRQLYDAVTAEYRHQMEQLLMGRIEPVEEFVGKMAAREESLLREERGKRKEESLLKEERGKRKEEREHSLSTIPEPKALRAVVRTLMHAYAAGLRAGGRAQVAQPTVLRLMAESAAALLHDEPLSVWADADSLGLDGIYRRACRTQAAYETLLSEMNMAYDELAQG